MDEDYKATLERAVRYLCNGADAVCADMILNRGVPRFNYMTGGYTWDDDYVWDSWANFQWVGFLTGRLWLLHLMTHDQRYADAAMRSASGSVRCSPGTRRCSPPPASICITR